MGKKKGIDITGAFGAFDDEYVTVPKGELGIKKKDKSLTLSLEKPFSKKSKQNINSTIGATFTKEGKDSSLSLTGSKTGKSKNWEVSFSKSFNKGGEARGGGAAIRGKGFKGVF